MEIAHINGYLEICLAETCVPAECKQQLDQYLQQHNIATREKVKVNFNIKRNAPDDAFCIIEHFIKTMPKSVKIKLNNINLFNENPGQLQKIVEICNKASNLYGMGHIIVYANQFQFPYLERVVHRTKFRIFKPHHSVFNDANQRLFLQPEVSFTLDHMPQQLPLHILAALREDRFNVIDVFNYHNTVQTPYSDAAYHIIEEYYGAEEAVKLLKNAQNIIQENKTLLKQAFLKHDPEIIKHPELQEYLNGSRDIFTITNKILQGIA